jgi:hypothetical protein
MPSTSSYARSLQEGEIFDLPPQPVQRYLVEKVTSRHVIWRFNNKVRAMPPGRTLRIETLAPAVVHWSADGWRTVHDDETRDTTLGVQVADLETLGLHTGDRVDFTLYWPEAKRWEGADFVVCVEGPSADSTMAGQFIAFPALDRIRDVVEDHVRARVEQDKMASQKNDTGCRPGASVAQPGCSVALSRAAFRPGRCR